MNTWGKRPYSSLPETGSFEELTVKKLKFGDCPISLPTDCPLANGSTLSVDIDGSATWSSLPPVGVPDRIQDAANTCSVQCTGGDVFMQGAGGGIVECASNVAALGSGSSAIVVYPFGVALGLPDGLRLYTDDGTTRVEGPAGACAMSFLGITVGNRVQLVAPAMQLVLPTSGVNKVLTCVDGTGMSEWSDPAIPNRIQDPGNVSSRVWCDSDNIYIQPEIGLQLDLDSNVPGKVLTCIDVDGTAAWQDPAPAAIPSRIQDLGGAVVECVAGNVAIITPASGQVTIGASAVATSKITLESAALQVSIPSVGTNKVLTSIDAVGNAEWRSIPVVTAPDRIRNAAGTVEVLCSSSDLFVMAGPTFPGYVLTSTATSGICQWQSVLGISATLGGLANQVTLRNTLQINGNMGTAISNNNNGPGACYITPRPMTLVAIQYDLVSSTTSTVFTIYRNTGVIGTFSPSLGSPLRGNQPFVPVAGQSGVMSQGAFVSVKWTAGTQPNGSLVTLYFT